MVIEYMQTHEDYLRLAKIHFKKAPGFRKKYIFKCIFLFLTVVAGEFVVYEYLYYVPYFSLLRYVPLLIGCAIGAIITRRDEILYYQPNIRKQLEKHDPRFRPGPMRVCVMPAFLAVVEVSPYIVKEIPYGQIEYIINDADYLCIYYGEYVVIPTTAFGEPYILDQFLRQIAVKREQPPAIVA